VYDARRGPRGIKIILFRQLRTYAKYAPRWLWVLMNFYGIITKPPSGLRCGRHTCPCPCSFVHHERICEAQHDDRLSSCAYAFIASCVHARPYYIPKAFSLIESYGLGLTNGADTCHDTNARWKIISQYPTVAPFRVVSRVVPPCPRSVPLLLSSNKTVGVLRGEK